MFIKSDDSDDLIMTFQCISTFYLRMTVDGLDAKTMVLA